MAKLLSIFVITIVILHVKAGKKEDMKDMLKGMSEDCIKSTQASDADFDEMFGNKAASTKNGKCLKQCLMVQFEMMDKDGKFNEEGVERMISMMAQDDEEKVKHCREIYKICSEPLKDEKEPCEKAEKYTVCAFKESQKRGLAKEFEDS